MKCIDFFTNERFKLFALSNTNSKLQVAKNEKKLFATTSNGTRPGQIVKCQLLPKNK